jgi:hypothetical protein
MQSAIAIIVPSTFTEEDEWAVLAYLQNQLRGRVAWEHASIAFDRLNDAIIVIDGVQITFRNLYRQEIDQNLAQSYLNELLTLDDVVTESPALWARYARQIMAMLRQRGWLRAGLPETRLLASYVLYWWNSFARGYAVEEGVFRDLRRSGQARTFVAMLQADVWEELNGDTVVGTLDAIGDNLSTPLRISERGQTLVVLSYEEWKARIRRQQGGSA